MGVFLRADLTGHGQFSQSVNFRQKGWDGHVLLGPQKKLETYFDLLYIWTFAHCAIKIA